MGEDHLDAELSRKRRETPPIAPIFDGEKQPKRRQATVRRDPARLVVPSGTHARAGLTTKIIPGIFGMSGAKGACEEMYTHCGTGEISIRWSYNL